MEKLAGILLVLLLALLMIAVVLLLGCASNDQAQGNAGYQYGNRPGFGNRSPQGMGNFGNLTDEQRQQMFEDRMKEASAACEGKSAGDACIIQSPRGNMTSTCERQNGTLMCAGGFPRGGGFGGAPPSQN